MAERISWSVETYPHPQVYVNAFFTSRERCQQLDVPLAKITQRYSEEIAANFAAEGRPNAWEPLADATIKSRIARGQGEGPILHATGALEEDAVDPSSWDMGGSGQFATAELSTVGYGRFHISGAPAINMPVRDWTYTDPSFDEEVDQIFLDDWAFEPFWNLP